MMLTNWVAEASHVMHPSQLILVSAMLVTFLNSAAASNSTKGIV
jgi:hypothetical protein